MKKPMFLAAAVGGFLALPAAAQAVCPYSYQPVCAANWDRYANACLALEAGTQPLNSGALISVEDSEGGVLFFWSTNNEFIDEATSIANGLTPMRIPVLNLTYGSLCTEPHEFYPDPQDISWADVAAENCDANLSYMDANLYAWMSEIGRWCPWQPTGLTVWDYR